MPRVVSFGGSNRGGCPLETSRLNLAHEPDFRLGRVEVRPSRLEVSRGPTAARVTPQVMRALIVLARAESRVVTRAELVRACCEARFVGDDAINRVISLLRRLAGQFDPPPFEVHTVRGVGFRLEPWTPGPSAELVGGSETADLEDRDSGSAHSQGSRPSVAVLPFNLVGDAGAFGAIADGLPYELISELSRLRWLFVVARGSSFRLRGIDVTPARVRAALGVGYVVSGAVELAGDQLTVTVELCETEDGGVIWSGRFGGRLEAVHEIRAEIVRAVVVALELQVQIVEAQRAMTAPERLDAWASYHLGISQLYRFDRLGTDRAAARFAQAIHREPGFARAYAGLSFAHFESAFLHFAADRITAVESARRYAERSLELDPLDPFCNLVMGRAAWLTDDFEAAAPWLDRALALNPNYAQAKYSSALTRTLLGETGEGQALADAARGLSPLDPLLYGMLGVRAFSHVALDEPEQAAVWGERAARAPRAHPLIELIAAVGHGLNGDTGRASEWAASARRRQPGIGVDAFLEAFPFRSAAVRARITRVLSDLAV